MVGAEGALCFGGFGAPFRFFAFSTKLLILLSA
jgi:hypothetical protein